MTCEELGMKINLRKLAMDLTYRKTASHLDDFKYASKKVSDLYDVTEQEWRNNHVVHHDTLPYCFLFWVLFSFTCTTV
jgi:hypothetical protein